MITSVFVGRLMGTIFRDRFWLRPYDPQEGPTEPIKIKEKGHVLVVARVDISAENVPKIIILVPGNRAYVLAAGEGIIGPMIAAQKLMWKAIPFPPLLPIRETGRGPRPRAPEPMCMGQ